MEIRLTGERAEIRRAIAEIEKVLDVRSASVWYPNRGSTRLGRVYIDAVPARGEQ